MKIYNRSDLTTLDDTMPSALNLAMLGAVSILIIYGPMLALWLH